MAAEEFRFNWIYAFVDATRWAITHELTGGNSHTINLFGELHESLCAWWETRVRTEAQLQRNIRAIRSGYGTAIQAPLGPSIRYCLDLEAELWGPDVANYVDRRQLAASTHVEVFKFVDGFYVFEQAIVNLLIAIRHAVPTTHWATRQALWSLLFGSRQFQVGWPFPLTMTADPRHVVVGQAEVNTHRGYASASSFAYVGRDHYIDVIQGALRGAARWLREEKPHLQHRPSAGWYDVIWHYSESFRYKDLAVSAYARQNPFFWNLSVRWVYSFLASLVELWLYTIFGRNYLQLCAQLSAISAAPAIASCFNPRWARLGASNFAALIR